MFSENDFSPEPLPFHAPIPKKPDSLSYTPIKETPESLSKNLVVDALNLMDIKTDALDALDPTHPVIEILKSQIFDRGFNQKLPALGPISLSNNKEPIHFPAGEPLPVFNSGAGARIIQTGKYKVQFTFDVHNLYSANQVTDSENNKSGRYGDRLLYNAVQAIYEKFAGQGAILARVGGDEFAVLLPTDKKIAITQTSIAKAIQEKVGVFKIGDQIISRKASAQVYEIANEKDPNYPRVLKIIAEQAEQLISNPKKHGYTGCRKALLENHPMLKQFKELSSNLEQDSQKESIEEIFGLLQTLVQDPLMEEAIRERVRVGEETIFPFKDPHDMLGLLEGDPGNYTLVKIEIPGILKYFNDQSEGRYSEGDDFIKKTGLSILDTLQNKGIQRKILCRRGGDFYIALHNSTLPLPAETTKEEFIAQLKKALFEKLHTGIPLEIPIIPAITSSEMEIKANRADGSEKSIKHSTQESTQNFQQLSAAFEDCSVKIWDSLIYNFTEYYSSLPRPSMESPENNEPWVFLINFLNPHDRRGNIRLRRFIEHAQQQLPEGKRKEINAKTLISNLKNCFKSNKKFVPEGMWLPRAVKHLSPLFAHYD